MLSKEKLCNKLVEFSKQHLGFEFNDVYKSEEDCYENFECILSKNPFNVGLEIDDAITDLLLYGDMENIEERKLCESYLNLAYELNIYNKYFKEKKKNEEKDI